jgi:hypothetical protein
MPFFAGSPPTAPFTNKVTTTRISQMQGDIVLLDMDNMTRDKRNRVYFHCMKEIHIEKVDGRKMFSSKIRRF